MKKNETNKPATKKVYNLVIVDESGSMCVIHREALAGINETISTCQKMQELHPELEQHITLVTFDSHHFKVHFDNILAKDARQLTMQDYSPNAATPLYDAIGKSIAKLNAQTTAEDNVLVTIITDGEENCSREYNLKMVNNLIEKLKEQKWTFTLIGTDNLDVESMAKEMSIDNNLCFSEDPTSTRMMFNCDCDARERYFSRICKGEAMPKGSYFDNTDNDKNK